MRILKALGVTPRARSASRSGAARSRAARLARLRRSSTSPRAPEPSRSDELRPACARCRPAPLTLKPEHAKLAAYFNLDNGTGKIRGIYLQENAAVRADLRELARAVQGPRRDHASRMRNTGGTDHQSFDGVGLPGFQFIQDPIEYERAARTTPNMDVYERAAARRPDAGRGGDGDVRLGGREPRRRCCRASRCRPWRPRRRSSRA